MAKADDADSKPEPDRPRKIKAGRRQSGLPDLLPGGLPVHEMYTVAYTMLKGALPLTRRAHRPDEDLPELSEADHALIKRSVTQVRFAEIFELQAELAIAAARLPRCVWHKLTSAQDNVYARDLQADREFAKVRDCDAARR